MKVNFSHKKFFCKKGHSYEIIHTRNDILYPQFTHYLYHINFMSFSSYKLNSHLTCFRRSFIAQSVEHHTGIAEVMVQIPLEPQNFFWALFVTELQIYLSICSSLIWSLSYKLHIIHTDSVNLLTYYPLQNITLFAYANYVINWIDISGAWRVNYVLLYTLFILNLTNIFKE